MVNTSTCGSPAPPWLADASVQSSCLAIRLAPPSQPRHFAPDDTQGLEVTAVTPAEDVIPPDATPPREMIEIIELQLRAEEGTGAAVGNAEDCS